MSQTVVRPGGGPPAGAAPVTARGAAAPPPPPVARLRGRLRGAFDGTPGRLRAAVIVGVLACLVFAALGGNAFRARGDALDQANKSATQLVRVQQVAIDVARADALVTNAFLQGAGEPAGVVSEYQAAIGAASRGLAQAAQAEPGDATALGEANSALTRYTAAVASARANNRQGFQVGSGYLRQASNLLRTPTAGQAAVLPTLDAVATADAARVGDAFDDARNATFQLFAAGLVVLAGLLAVQVWLARRTRRILNIPLTWGSAAVLVCLIVGVVVLVTGQSAANRVRDTHYAATRALSQARIAAFDARANEGLTLVYQGSGAEYEKKYQDRLATARTQVDAAKAAGVDDPGRTELDAWDTAHQQVRKLDDGGDWPGAVKLATDPSQPSQKAFVAFDATSGSALGTEAKALSAGLQDRHWLLVLLGFVTLIAGLVAAAAAGIGIAQRLGEYR